MTPFNRGNRGGNRGGRFQQRGRGSGFNRGRGNTSFGSNRSLNDSGDSNGNRFFGSKRGGSNRGGFNKNRSFGAGDSKGGFFKKQHQNNGFNDSKASKSFQDNRKQNFVQKPKFNKKKGHLKMVDYVDTWATQNDNTPDLAEMNSEDSDDDIGSMKEYEDMSGEDDFEDEEESETEAVKQPKPTLLEVASSDESDDELPVKKTFAAKPTLLEVASSDESDDELPVKKVIPKIKLTAKGEKLPDLAIKTETQRRLEFLKLSLFVEKTSDALIARKHLAQIHPFITSMWKIQKSLLFVFDSLKSRAKAMKHLETYEDQEIKVVKFEPAENVKGLLEEPTNKANPKKLLFKRFPHKIGKKSFQVLFPEANAYDLPTVGEAIVTFKSAEDAQKVLESLQDFKMIGCPVLASYYREK